MANIFKILQEIDEGIKDDQWNISSLVSQSNGLLDQNNNIDFSAMRSVLLLSFIPYGYEYAIDRQGRSLLGYYMFHAADNGSGMPTMNSVLNNPEVIEFFNENVNGITNHGDRTDPSNNNPVYIGELYNIGSGFFNYPVALNPDPPIYLNAHAFASSLLYMIELGLEKGYNVSSFYNTAFGANSFGLDQNHTPKDYIDVAYTLSLYENSPGFIQYFDLQNGNPSNSERFNRQREYRDIYVVPSDTRLNIVKDFWVKCRISGNTIDQWIDSYQANGNLFIPTTAYMLSTQFPYTNDIPHLSSYPLFGYELLIDFYGNTFLSRYIAEMAALDNISPVTMDGFFEGPQGTFLNLYMFRSWIVCYSRYSPINDGIIIHLSDSFAEDNQNVLLPIGISGINLVVFAKAMTELSDGWVVDPPGTSYVNGLPNQLFKIHEIDSFNEILAPQDRWGLLRPSHFIDANNLAPVDFNLWNSSIGKQSIDLLLDKYNGQPCPWTNPGPVNGGGGGNGGGSGGGGGFIGDGCPDGPIGPTVQDLEAAMQQGIVPVLGILTQNPTLFADGLLELLEENRGAHPGIPKLLSLYAPRKGIKFKRKICHRRSIRLCKEESKED